MATEQSGYVGVVKSYRPDKGYGFISCPETEELYGKDIILLSKLKGEIKVNPGDEVSFEVQDGQKGPEAINVQVLSEGNFPEPTEIERGGPGFYVGNVKSYNKAKGWGFVCCAETFQIYGKDIILIGGKTGGAMAMPGERVRFRVVEGDKGPEVADLDVLSGKMRTIDDDGNRIPLRTGPNSESGEYVGPRKGAGSGKGGKGAGAGKSAYGGAFKRSAEEYPAARKAPREQNWNSPPPSSVVGPFRGVIKSYSEKYGRGFIQCATTERRYGKDIIVYQKDIAPMTVAEGDHVTFSVVERAKGPEAVEIINLSGGGGGGGGGSKWPRGSAGGAGGGGGDPPASFWKAAIEAAAAAAGYGPPTDDLDWDGKGAGGKGGGSSKGKKGKSKGYSPY